MSNQAITRIFDIPYYQLEKYHLDKAFSSKYQGEWQSVSTKQYIDQANAISRGLLRLGIKPNDKIAFISTTNRTEWNICDIGVLQIGAQNVPIYPTISHKEYAYILNHSEVSYCFISDSSILEKLNKIKSETSLKEIFTFDQIQGQKNWKEILELGQDSSNQQEVEEIKKSIQTDDLATIIYTSGTTGDPKGVMLSHKNIVSNLLASEKRVPLDYGNTKALSFLPVCHIFERLILYLYQHCGVSIYFAESVEKFGENAREISPNVMTAVPRLYEKIYDAIYAKATELTGIKKKLLFWAIGLGLRYKPYRGNGWCYEVKLKIARKIVFSKWQAALGGQIKIMVSGSAPLQPRLIRIFTAAGIPIMEGYGLTETSPVVSVNDVRNGGLKIGTAGKPIDNVEVKIAEDGEILIKGPNVMLGYYKDPKKTESVLKDGYLHTGDKGNIKDGFLEITGRKKDMFKTSGGKYIIPGLLESALIHSRFIEQAMVVGEREKMPAAIIQPNFNFLVKWAERYKISFDSYQDLVSNPKVIDRFQKEVTKANQNFGKWEKIKRFELTPDEWSVDAGQLTPTMKMKRDVIKTMYKDLYEKIYRERV